LSVSPGRTLMPAWAEVLGDGTISRKEPLGGHPQLVAKTFDGSQTRRSLGCPTINAELEALGVHLAQENRSLGDKRIAGAMTRLGYTVSAPTVGNILTRQGIRPAPERKHTTTWKACIRTHMDVLVATDFFAAGGRPVPSVGYVELVGYQAKPDL
jgi:putative transposase